MSFKVTYADILAARQRIGAVAQKTPLGYSRSCTQWVGTPTFLKFENLQVTGSFKIRGALNKIIQLTPEEQERGVVASSAGNHAQGVAYGATYVGAKSIVVMPETSPLVKVLATQGYGAEVVLHGRSYDDAYAHARLLEKEHHYTFVHPYEDPAIIAGQGTVGLEILEDLPDVDSVILSIGGGGLISGTAMAIKEKRPNCKIFGVVTETYSGMKSLYENLRPVTDFPYRTIADGIAVKNPSPIMYEQFISKYVDDIASIAEPDIAQAIVFLLERAKTLVEGSAAIALAAAVKADWDLGQKCCVVLSGGNIDLNMVAKVIEKGQAQAGRIARIRVKVTDQPGTLHLLTSIIAQQEANVLEVRHDRLGHGLQLRETAIEFLLETKDDAHRLQIIEALCRVGAQVEDAPLT